MSVSETPALSAFVPFDAANIGKFIELAKKNDRKIRSRGQNSRKTHPFRSSMRRKRQKDLEERRKMCYFAAQRKRFPNAELKE